MVKNILSSKLNKIFLIVLSLLCINFVSAEDNYNFDVQKFINSDMMYNYIIGHAYEKPPLRLFTIERQSASSSDYHNCGSTDELHGSKNLSCSPFNNYDLDEADLFVKQYSGGNRTYFNKLYQTLDFVQISKPWVGVRDMEAYDIGVYKVKDALKEVVESCNLGNEALTNFSVNKPASNHTSIMYVITTQNSNGECNQSLFDTYRKTISCKVIKSDCYL